MATVYNLENAFKRIEDNLVNEIINGIKTTSPTAVLKEDNINVWRAGQLKALQDFKKRNKQYFSKDNEKELKKQIRDVLTDVYKTAGTKQQKKILEAIDKGLEAKPIGSDDYIISNFNGINDRKLKALMAETEKNLYKAETSAVRYAEDKYRQIIFDSSVYFNTGAGNLIKCIDMATKDFLSAGINNVEYKNGRRVNVQSYAEMALRTAEKRSYIQGEASMRDNYGLGLVIVNRRGNACPKCMQFVGKVFNDDVYGNVKINSKYPLLSEAIAGGLYHPNCKDVHTTYFPGITTERPAPTKEEMLEAEKQYALEQQQRFNERQIRKYKRLSDGTLDEEQQKFYKQKLEHWQIKQDELIRSNDTLRRKDWRESVVATVKPSAETISDEMKDFDDLGITTDFIFMNRDGKKLIIDSLTPLFNEYKFPTKDVMILDDSTMKAYGAYDLKEKAFYFKPSKYTDLDKLKQEIKEQIELGKFMSVPDDKILLYPQTHEFGHYLQGYLFEAEMKKTGKKLLESEYINFADKMKSQIITTYARRTGDKTLKTLNSKLSTYAKTGGKGDPKEIARVASREFFAEAFADYQLNGKNAIFFEEFETMFKKMKRK